ncbi:MAG: hypothetical protein FWE35_29340 [Streptosporangiales bacterium]|nr:hypothetical protein [Streptosporangiales bacterium]
MQPQELPTFEEIERHAREHLDRARGEMSEVRDWLRSDWQPPWSPRPTGTADAYGEVLRIAGEVKGLIDQAKRTLERP